MDIVVFSNLAQGVHPREVARRVRVAAGSVYRWQQVDDAQREQLGLLLLQGARAAGSPTNCDHEAA